MKHRTDGNLILFGLLALVPLCAFAQGRVGFANTGASGLVTNSLSGQPVPVGTAFKVALYFAPDGVTDEREFVQLGASVGFAGEPGHFSGGTREVPGVDGGDYAMFQVRAWESAFGATYEEAVSNPNAQGGRLALAGKTGIMRVQPGFGTQPAASLVNDRVQAIVGSPLRDGFVLTVVPEPTSALLWLTGIVGLVVCACRRLL